MKTSIIRTLILGTFSIALAACFPVRIVTTAPAETVYVEKPAPAPTTTTVVVREQTPPPAPAPTPAPTVQTTVVTAPSTPTTTTTVKVTALTSDLSYYLDLQAVAAAFAQANSIREFEQLLNSPKYMINNLDLNGDGYVDYLRVLEGQQGYRHVYLIQACLAQNIFQDVATLVAEAQTSQLYVEVIGDPYIYGHQYIVRPVWVKRPPMWDYMRRGYSIWTSPYYYGHYPSQYEYMKCVFLSHYMAYVESYMHNHHYCNHCDYPTSYYYPQYTEVTKPHTRQDYATQYPQNSFSGRNAKVYTSSSVGAAQGGEQRVVRNASELRQAASASGATTRTSGTTTTTPSTTRTPSSTTTTTPSGSTSTPRTSSSTTTSISSPSSPSSSSSSSSSSSTTRTPSSTSTTSSSGSTRTPSSTTTPRTTTTPSTTVTTRVNTSGATRTTIRTTDESGRSTSVQRTTPATRTTTPSTRTTPSTTPSTRTGSGSGSSTRSGSGSDSRSGSGSGSSPRTR